MVTQPGSLDWPFRVVGEVTWDTDQQVCFYWWGYCFTIQHSTTASTELIY
jgi:hypothetical protein